MEKVGKTNHGRRDNKWPMRARKSSDFSSARSRSPPSDDEAASEHSSTLGSSRLPIVSECPRRSDRV